MPKKGRAAPDDPEQSGRFVETAKAVDCCGGHGFTRVFRTIVPQKKKRQSKSATVEVIGFLVCLCPRHCLFVFSD